eukprot:4047092-Amphidinium_carterae.1
MSERLAVGLPIPILLLILQLRTVETMTSIHYKPNDVLPWYTLGVTFVLRPKAITDPGINVKSSLV